MSDFIKSTTLAAWMHVGRNFYRYLFVYVTFRIAVWMIVLMSGSLLVIGLYVAWPLVVLIALLLARPIVRKAKAFMAKHR